MSYYNPDSNMRFSVYKMLTAWIARDPVKSSIAISVIITHLSAVLFLSWNHFTPEPKKNHKLVVKTFQETQKNHVVADKIQVKKNTPVQKTPPPSKTHVDTAKKVEPAQVPSKTAEKGSVKKPVNSSAPKTPVKKSSAIPQDLLDELDRKISKIEEKKTSNWQHSELSIPQKIQIPSKIEQQLGSCDMQAIDNGLYSELLISYLKERLNLPDFGEVKVEITLKKNGSVESFRVLSSASDKNKSYIKQNLPLLKFPEFQGREKNIEKQTFVLTFCNEL